MLCRSRVENGRSAFSWGAVVANCMRMKRSQYTEVDVVDGLLFASLCASSTRSAPHYSYNVVNGRLESWRRAEEFEGSCVLQYRCRSRN